MKPNFKGMSKRLLNAIVFTILLPFMMVETVFYPLEYIIFGVDAPFLMEFFAKHFDDKL